MSKLNKAIFLDRDGVINELILNSEDGIVDSPNSAKQFKLTKNVTKSLAQLKKMGYLLILISNQPGIAKRKYTISEFKKIQKKMERDLQKYGVSLDAQYYCLHHPNALDNKYKKNCLCRKPKTKMLKDGVKDHNIDLKKSFVIGDGLVDMELAKKTKCRGIFIGNVNSAITKIFHDKRIEPHYIAHDMKEAVKSIIQ